MPKEVYLKMEMKRKGMGIGFNSVIALVMVLIGLTVLLSVAKAVIPTASVAYYELSRSYTNTTLYGADAVSFAATTPALVGWFWVIGPFVLVLVLVIGIFFKGKHR